MVQFEQSHRVPDLVLFEEMAVGRLLQVLQEGAVAKLDLLGLGGHAQEEVDVHLGQELELSAREEGDQPRLLDQPLQEVGQLRGDPLATLQVEVGRARAVRLVRRGGLGRRAGREARVRLVVGSDLLLGGWIGNVFRTGLGGRHMVTLFLFL